MPKRILNKEVAHLKSQGVTLPKNPVRAAQSAHQMRKMATNPGQMKSDVTQSFSKQFDSYSKRPNEGSLGHLEENNRLVQSMRRSRMQKTAGGTSSDIAVAIPRFYDPLEYWDLSGLPWNMADEGHRHKLHKWLRLYYATHYLIPILVDIFTRFPLAGMHLYSKDKKITEFYEDVFLDRLDYEEFLVQLGREYWTVGEAWPMGSFHESLGVWEREELMNPEDIVIERYPLLGTQEFKVVPPEYLKRLVTTKSPAKEYQQLRINFPELIPYLLRGEPFPVSDVLLKQVAFKTTSWDDHGTPILLRSLRTLLHEEKLLASQDAIAERLYSPLILAKLGVNDMGDGHGPWIPGPDQLESFRDDMDIALSSDFRLMVYHYALEVENVFGREQVPDLWNDFDRIERRLMQSFGINPGLLSAGSNAQPYASSALQAEFMNQILRTFQKYLKAHFRERAMVVAEAQGHYDYEKRGDTRIPIMEEVVEVDEETGEIHIEERHALLIPELEMQVLDMRDEATERQFLMGLRQMGVPISDENLMVGVSFEFKDSLDEMQEEMIQKTVSQQMAKMQTYKILTQQGLPIPPDLKAEIEGQQAQPGADAPPGGIGDMGAPGGASVGAPAPGGGGGTVMPEPPPDLGSGGTGGPTPGGGPPPASPATSGPAGSVPAVSNERRPGMPTAASVSVEELDERIAACKQTLSDMDDARRQRTASSTKKLAQRVAAHDEPELKWDWTKKIVIDKVPRSVREAMKQYGLDD
jgi:hypothetical protein